MTMVRADGSSADKMQIKLTVGTPAGTKAVAPSCRIRLQNEGGRRIITVGSDYPLNEYRARWTMGGQALAQRLRDKNHAWTDLQQLNHEI